MNIKIYLLMREKLDENRLFFKCNKNMIKKLWLNEQEYSKYFYIGNYILTI